MRGVEVAVSLGVHGAFAEEIVEVEEGLLFL
jgi:hypothetical protein